MSAQQGYDVIICGAGPVGLLLSLQLARLGLSTLTIEQHDKSKQSVYGRASTLYPRTLEMLDQLDLADDLTQVGLIGRGHVTYRDGKSVPSYGWGFLSRIKDSYYDYLLNIRQKYSEGIFRAALEKHGRTVRFGWVLQNFRMTDASEHRVSADIVAEDGKPVTVVAKYLIGADGGKSTVRRVAQIPFIGDSSSKFHWVRLDAVVKTNMPNDRIGFAALESPTHGNVLWASLDHGRSRIGFALSSELYESHGNNITEEIVREEAVKAMAPFDLEIVQLDWWTLYSIGQRVAETFQFQERILLAGDAAHTHSSGTAQGMNTGVHDAVNLGWKLAGILRGWYKPAILETYSPERRSVANHLIHLDKTISALISGTIPEGYTGNRHGDDANLCLYDYLEESSQFTLGLGVSYDVDDLLNKRFGISHLTSGHRGPDVLVRRPGSSLATRLFELTRNKGKFWILVFSGNSLQTRSSIKKLRQYVDSEDSFVHALEHAFNFITIISGTGLQADEALGVKRFGFACYDVDGSAYQRYGITPLEGGIVVLRPDGIVSLVAELDECPTVGRFFDDIVYRRKRGTRGETLEVTARDKGEVFTEVS
ncbi:hypothetical protein Q7P37_001523 [Cladosporium fusiforme]